MKKVAGLAIVLLLFVNVVFADVIMPGGNGHGLRWPAQRVKFSNVSSLGKYLLHLQFYNSFSNNIYNDIIIKRDTIFFTPEHGGSPSPQMRFFALLNKKNTDTIEITDADVDFNFSGIKKNKLQFAKKTKNASLSTLGNLDNSDNEGNSFKLDKLLLGLSLSAIVGLIFLFIFYKKKNSLNLRSNPSA